MMDWPTAFSIVGCALAIAWLFGVNDMNSEFELWRHCRGLIVV